MFHGSGCFGVNSICVCGLWCLKIVLLHYLMSSNCIMPDVVLSNE